MVGREKSLWGVTLTLRLRASAAPGRRSSRQNKQLSIFQAQEQEEDGRRTTDRETIRRMRLHLSNGSALALLVLPVVPPQRANRAAQIIMMMIVGCPC